MEGADEDVSRSFLLGFTSNDWIKFLLFLSSLHTKIVMFSKLRINEMQIVVIEPGRGRIINVD